MKERCDTVMSKNVQTCSETDSAESAARLMRDRNVGLVPIVDSSQKVCGVITDRDLAVRVLADGRNGDTPLKDIMSSGNLVTVHADQPLGDAEERMMKAGTSRALVLDRDDRVIGVISESDISFRENPKRTGEVISELKRNQRVAGRRAQ